MISIDHRTDHCLSNLQYGCFNNVIKLHYWLHIK